MRYRIMKYGLAVVCAAFISTGCERGKVVRDNEGVNDWIYSVMAEHYLWSGFMPAKDNTDLSLGPQGYFQNELMTKNTADPLLNDRFSYIIHKGDFSEGESGQAGEYAAKDVLYDFGFFTLLGSIDGSRYCQVLYVEPGSPAYKQNIRRGDCFTSVNGVNISSASDFNYVMESGQITIDFFYPEERIITLQKGNYKEMPILLDTVYDLSPATGYIVYNHFVQGENKRYFEELKTIFRKFKDAGIENLILDLRYNGGGELLAAQQLASLMAPASELGKVFMYKERSGSYGNAANYEPDILLPDVQIKAANPDVKNIYILTSKVTASASELIIHCMRPFFEDAGGVFIIAGDKTYGKNVGGISVTNKRYEWEIHPITLRVYDKNKISGYHYGISPDMNVSELFEIDIAPSGRFYTVLGDFGDVENERMLRRVMDKVYGVNGWCPPGAGFAAPYSLQSPDDGVTRSIDAGSGTDKFIMNIPQRGLIEKRYYVY